MRRSLRGREAVSRLLALLDGTWRGTGDGGYPTLDPFAYREVLRLTRHETNPLLHIEQRTWRDEDGREVPSHWESGFLRFLGGGRLDLTNAQSGGRTEVMVGTAWHVADDGAGEAWELRLEAIDHANDERMRAARRRWWIRPAELRYEMEMATASHPSLALHLRAELTRARR